VDAPEQPPRELTLEEAIAVAILLQKNGQLAEAEKLYGAIFETAPDNPEALQYAGVLAHQQGRSEEGPCAHGQEPCAHAGARRLA